MKPDELNNKLIAYLYDEMRTEERLYFENEMEKDPELKKMYEEFRQLRKGLAHLEDKEVMEPFFLWGKNGASYWTRMFRRRSLIMFRPYIAVAATILLIFTMAYLTDFAIVYEKDKLYIGFNQAGSAEQQELTENQVISIVKDEIERNNAVLGSRLDETEKTLNKKLASIESSRKQSPVTLADDRVTEEDLQQYFRKLQNNNSRAMKEFMQTATIQQQEYFQAVLTQFSDYLQEQREEDLRAIRRNMVNLKENQDQQQLETQQILATLINNVNNQSN